MIRIDEARFEEVYNIMIEAFPFNERRSKEEQLALFHHPLYEIYASINNHKICAFITIWKMENVHFVEHLAVDHSMRGSGIGKELLQEYMQKNDCPIILEVERDEDDIAQRRIHFYERLGFILYPDITYAQPTFHVGQDDVPLYIMSYPYLENEQLLVCIKELYETVYGRVYL